MRVFTRFILLFILLYCISFSESIAQKKGTFSENIDFQGGKRLVEFHVPSSYNSSTPSKLIIAMHPRDTHPEMMTMMLKDAANDRNAILVAPDDRIDHDGGIIPVLMEYVFEKYNIDMENIILTGYSAGAYTTFSYGFQNHTVFKGLIMIAGAGYFGQQQMAVVDRLPLAFICGTSDDAFSSINSLVNTIILNYGIVKFIKKQGIGHVGEYYMSTEINDDWLECYDFIQDAVLKPAVPELLSPTNYATLEPGDVELVWYKADGAEKYQYGISTDDAVIDGGQTNDTSITLTDLSTGVRYYWKVYSENDGGHSEWSQEFSFIIEIPAPEDAVVLYQPVDNSKNMPLNMTIRWNKNEQALSYDLEIYKDGSKSPFISESLEATEDDVFEYDLEDLEQGSVYTWQVRAVNDGGEGPWSELWTFTTLIVEPETKPTLNGPEDMAEDVPTTITLSWEAIEYADRYHIQITKDGEEAPYLEDSTVIENNDGELLYEAIDLEGLTKYLWRVRGINHGVYGPWSDTKSFTTWNPASVKYSYDRYSYFKSSLLPNPVSDKADIVFEMKETADVSIDIFDTHANHVICLQRNQYMEAGSHRVSLDVTTLSNGTYTYRIIAKDNIETGKIIVLK